MVLLQKDGNSEVQYTRDGAFYLSPVSPNQTMLVTSAGNPILDENNNPININGQAKGYSVTENGSLVVEMTGGEKQTINLGVTLVNKPQFLVSKGDNLLGLPDNLGELIARDEGVRHERHRQDEEQGRGARRQGQGGRRRRDRQPRPAGGGPGRPGQRQPQAGRREGQGRLQVSRPTRTTRRTPHPPGRGVRRRSPGTFGTESPGLGLSVPKVRQPASEAGPVPLRSARRRRPCRGGRRR